jgi:putative ABC transport system permease protein
MFKHYLTTAIRNLVRHRLYSLINIGGLTIGLAACLVITVFIRYEMSYESWLPNSDSIYRIDIRIFKNELGIPEGLFDSSMGPLKAALEDSFVEIQEATRTAHRQAIFRHDTEVFNETITSVDGNFFQVFELTFLAGQRNNALDDVHSIILSESLARKYFGSDDPINKVLSTIDGDTYRVTSVIADLPQNTSLSLEMLVLLDATSPGYSDLYGKWGNLNLDTYITLQPGTSIDEISHRFNDLLDNNVPLNIIGSRPSELFNLAPLALTDTHLHGTKGDSHDAGETKRYLQTLVAIGVLIFGIVVFNFVNSATAIAGYRAREIVLRKLAGAQRSQLIVQFVGETTGMVLIAFVLAMAIAQVALPWFTQVLDTPVNIDYAGEIPFLLALLTLIPVIGIIAGIYPALYLTRFRPARVLHSSPAGTSSTSRVRTTLILTQFSISIGLTIAASVVYLQLGFTATIDLGFKQENKIVLRGVGTPYASTKVDSLLTELAKIPGIQGIKRSQSVPGDVDISMFHATTPQKPDSRLAMQINPVDFGFFELYGVKFLAGRSINEEFSSDTLTFLENADKPEPATVSVVVNRTALKSLEFGKPEAAIGKVFNGQLGRANRPTNLHIVGVVEDFMERSIREEVTPRIYYRDLSELSAITVLIKPNSLPRILDEIEDTWYRVLPDQPIERLFLDDQLEALYGDTKSQSELLLFFAVLAVLISSLGLYGLAAFSAERRNREVGIRKVHGAKIVDIIRLFAWQFTKPILVANLIAWPVAWYLMRDWLTEFAYRIDLTPWPFIGAGFVVLLIANGTVVMHAAHAARTNPALVLKCE